MFTKNTMNYQGKNRIKAEPVDPLETAVSAVLVDDQGVDEEEQGTVRPQINGDPPAPEIAEDLTEIVNGSSSSPSSSNQQGGGLSEDHSSHRRMTFGAFIIGGAICLLNYNWSGSLVLFILAGIVLMSSQTTEAKRSSLPIKKAVCMLIVIGSICIIIAGCIAPSLYYGNKTFGHFLIGGGTSLLIGHGLDTILCFRSNKEKKFHKFVNSLSKLTAAVGDILIIVAGAISSSSYYYEGPTPNVFLIVGGAFYMVPSFLSGLWDLLVFVRDVSQYIFRLAYTATTRTAS